MLVDFCSLFLKKKKNCIIIFSIGLSNVVSCRCKTLALATKRKVRVIGRADWGRRHMETLSCLPGRFCDDIRDVRTFKASILYIHIYIYIVQYQLYLGGDKPNLAVIQLISIYIYIYMFFFTNITTCVIVWRLVWAWSILILRWDSGTLGLGRRFTEAQIRNKLKLIPRDSVFPVQYNQTLIHDHDQLLGLGRPVLVWPSFWIAASQDFLHVPLFEPTRSRGSSSRIVWYLWRCLHPETLEFVGCAASICSLSVTIPQVNWRMKMLQILPW